MASSRAVTINMDPYAFLQLRRDELSSRKTEIAREQENPKLTLEKALKPTHPTAGTTLEKICGDITTVFARNPSLREAIKMPPQDYASNLCLEKAGVEAYCQISPNSATIKQPVAAKCTHVFELASIQNWIQTKRPDCPICRDGVSATDLTYSFEHELEILNAAKEVLDVIADLYSKHLGHAETVPASLPPAKPKKSSLPPLPDVGTFVAKGPFYRLRSLAVQVRETAPGHLENPIACREVEWEKPGPRIRVESLANALSQWGDTVQLSRERTPDGRFKMIFDTNYQIEFIPQIGKPNSSGYYVFGKKPFLTFGNEARFKRAEVYLLAVSDLLLYIREIGLEHFVRSQRLGNHAIPRNVCYGLLAMQHDLHYEIFKKVAAHNSLTTQNLDALNSHLCQIANRTYALVANHGSMTALEFKRRNWMTNVESLSPYMTTTNLHENQELLVIPIQMENGDSLLLEELLTGKRLSSEEIEAIMCQLRSAGDFYRSEELSQQAAVKVH